MTNEPIFLSLGSNIGNREDMLMKAREKILEFAGVIKQASPIYETGAWGNTQQPSFLNQALELITPYPPDRLLQILLEIENSLGRVRTIDKWQARTVDIDILFYGDLQIKTGVLTLPHPELEKRKFVLVPLAQIGGGFIHPKYGKTILDLLAECPDQLEIRKLG